MTVAVEVTVREAQDGWIADVSVRGERTTAHRVRVTRDEHAHYGDGDVTDLVSRSFAFLLAREPNTSILRDFSLGTIERYFPEYAREIKKR